MGVKTYYLLGTDDKQYLGIKAYYKLMEFYKWRRERGRCLVFKEPSGGWRKRIRALYKHLIDSGQGGIRLSHIKTANPRNDKSGTLWQFIGKNKKKVKKKLTLSPTRPPTAPAPRARIEGAVVGRARPMSFSERLRQQQLQDLQVLRAMEAVDAQGQNRG